VRFGSGLIVHEVGVYHAGSRIWCSPPSRPWVHNDALVRDPVNGKLKYSPLIEFSTHGVRSSWSRQILTALQEQHPEALAEVAEHAEGKAML
jgi:hypothetical protein